MPDVGKPYAKNKDPLLRVTIGSVDQLDSTFWGLIKRMRRAQYYGKALTHRLIGPQEVCEKWRDMVVERLMVQVENSQISESEYMVIVKFEKDQLKKKELPDRATSGLIARADVARARFFGNNIK
jgi:hypothetical protein